MCCWVLEQANATTGAGKLVKSHGDFQIVVESENRQFMCEHHLGIFLMCSLYLEKKITLNIWQT